MCTAFYRRDFLADLSTGLAGVGLAKLLSYDGSAHAAGVSGEAADPPPHHAPRAKRVLQIFLAGGLSQVDSFDYKPELARYHGQPLPESERPDVFFGKVGLLHQSHWPFKQCGQSGFWVSELFPHVAECADELTLIHSMVSGSGNHTPAIYEANTGFRIMGFPVMGAWLSYGLGCETDELPTFVSLPDARGVLIGGANNWTAGFLPARHQGVAMQNQGTAIPDLYPKKPLPDAKRKAQYAMIAEMNHRHLESHGPSDSLEARINSYEMAAKMQLAVPQVLALQQETAETNRLYGLDDPRCADFGRTCLIARRLLERGVRFVQLWSGYGAGGASTWDSHDDVPSHHAREAVRVDRPIAGLLRDLKRRGMWDDTLVIFNTEFGRTPFAQSAASTLGKGRDHNQTAFTVWLAGAGLKPGFAYGETDPFGYRVVKDPVSVHDFHATLLHALGIDHERLTYYHNGIQRRLTNVHGHVIHELFV